MQQLNQLLTERAARFDPVHYDARTANKYGHVQVTQNTYTAGPQFSDPLCDWIDTAERSRKRRFFTALQYAAQANGGVSASTRRRWESLI
ncbi:hypothetical protein GCM10027417_03390 [Glutamicibacter endophyticus]